MIKVGITGCDNLRAAELVRVLINHPDVQLGWVFAPGRVGTRLDTLVPGIIGECDMVVSGLDDCDDVDIVFITEYTDSLLELMQALHLTQESHVVDMTGAHNLDHGGGKPWTYGLCEMQRRILVHDARWVTLPGVAATAALLTVVPLARNQMLNGELSLHVALGTCACDHVEGVSVEQWARSQADEVAFALKLCQPGFHQPVHLDVARLPERRTLTVSAKINNCGMDCEQLTSMYEQYYADHNFVFMADRPVRTADVENTNKCLLHIEEDDGNGCITVHGVMDALLKGGAGSAVHVMNLLFGLHERVGLALKSSGC